MRIEFYSEDNNVFWDLQENGKSLIFKETPKVSFMLSAERKEDISGTKRVGGFYLNNSKCNLEKLLKCRTQKDILKWMIFSRLFGGLISSLRAYFSSPYDLYRLCLKHPTNFLANTSSLVYSNQKYKEYADFLKTNHDKELAKEKLKVIENENHANTPAFEFSKDVVIDELTYVNKDGIVCTVK